MKPLVAQTLKLATRNIGVREIGRSNSGPEVSAWLRKVGAPDASPWCAAFVFSMCEDAAVALGMRNPVIRSAYTPDIGNWAKERSILIPSSVGRPQAGDIFLVRGAERFHHVGFVESVQSNSWTSIEGNSNSDGSREGYEVANNENKPFATRYYWVRWSALCDDPIDLNATMIGTPKPKTRELWLGGVLKISVPVADNISLCPVRTWCAWMGVKLEWKAGTETPIRINGVPLETDISIIDSVAYVPIRDLVALDKTLVVAFDSAKNRVLVSRKAALAGALATAPEVTR